MRRISRLLGACIVVVTIAAPEGVNAHSPNAGPPSCRVEDLSSGLDYTSKDSPTPVQTAIDAAAPGAILQIMGTCVGTSTIGKDLTIQGKATPKDPNPTLDGNSGGSVLTIDTANVSISRLEVRNGSASSGGGIFVSYGNVSLVSATIGSNTATNGGGIFLFFGGASIQDSSITGNTAGENGGGIFISAGTAAISGSTLSDNSAAVLGGGILNSFQGGAFVSNSAVTGNSASAGGGIANAGVTTLTDSSVSENTASAGGGIYNVGDAYLIGVTTIVGNAADQNGGGIWSDNALTIHASGDWTGLVSGNTPDNCEPSLTLGSTTCS